ncbi:aminopeptidase [Schizosaccharomyces japonicus yFS275]|uniref:Aminopeptidase n=1 Tax=Schizosaccharomyces japonicus (strain yFS275 / FY16936) TaxID=402676 RepID=B6JX42_SCHJY|nr:aminopeptidase [Schizosaccharomyces japonicus yFS275]EEB05943.1 aminopeptidase [Schizosaccharomyces japonicus yFS275]
MTVDTTERLAKLRELMKERNYSYYIVPSEDAHHSEYTCDADARRAFISGFDGSAGIAVIGMNSAAMFTDGRYFNQAGQQLDHNWTLMKVGLPGVPTWKNYCLKQAEPKSVIGIDSSLITFAEASSFRVALKAKDITLRGDHDNLVDKVWGSERPALPNGKMLVLGTEFAGACVSAKLDDVRKALEKNSLDAFAVTMLDEIAWVFNVRGSDVAYNPVFFAYALISKESAVLYLDEQKLTDEVRKHLEKYVSIKPYYAIFEDAKTISFSKVGVSDQASWCVATAFGENKITTIQSPIAIAKGVKNDVELHGMQRCHVRDGAALVEYFAWLDDYLAAGNEINEFDAATKLEGFRSKQEHFMGLSFETISSSGPNGAIIHYSPPSVGSAKLDPKKMYLCDSGGQYLDGTTDVTRTWHFTEPTAFEKRAATLVLKGQIDVVTSVFPKGTTGLQLDVLARQHLWKCGLDYLHGTGHGVGHFLNVHELPVGIGNRSVFNLPLKPGMVTSNEPGFYKDGSFGFRVENCVFVKEVETEFHFAGREYYGFKDLTMAPHCRKLIDTSLLSDEERYYIDQYHATVRKTLSPLLSERAKKWLETATEPL